MEFEEFKDLPEEPGEPTASMQTRPVLEDLRTGRKYPIPNYPMLIGREKFSSICITIPEISRKHAKVFERNGAFFIQDMGSINGTFVNDKRIIDPEALKDGDRIKISINKKYPKGAREYIFKLNVSEEEKLEQQRREERDRILKEVGLAGGAPTESKKVLLRHCIFQVSREQLIAFLLKTEDPHRVPLIKLDIAHNMLIFLDLLAYKIKDTVIVSIEHPRLPEPIKITTRIIGIQAKPTHNIIEHHGMIVKLSEKHKKILETTVTMSDLICYITSRRLTEQTNEDSKTL